MAKRKKNDVSIWVPVAVGTGLVLWPEPLTTATGLLILAGAFGFKIQQYLIK